jgi:phage terminase large subunit-like protein
MLSRPGQEAGSLMARRPEAWRQYAAGSELDHFAKFCREHLIQSEDRWEGKPLVLEPRQRRMMSEALAFDSDGWPTWRSVVIVVPRENEKTATLAALSLYRLLTSTGRPEILLAAPSDKVAGRLFDTAARFVRRSPSSHGPIATKDHPDSPRKIDAAVAAFVAYDRAMWHAANTPEREVLIAFT